MRFCHKHQKLFDFLKHNTWIRKDKNKIRLRPRGRQKFFVPFSGASSYSCSILWKNKRLCLKILKNYQCQKRLLGQLVVKKKFPEEGLLWYVVDGFSNLNLTPWLRTQPTFSIQSHVFAFWENVCTKNILGKKKSTRSIKNENFVPLTMLFGNEPLKETSVAWLFPLFLTTNRIIFQKNLKVNDYHPFSNHNKALELVLEFVSLVYCCNMSRFHPRQLHKKLDLSDSTLHNSPMQKENFPLKCRYLGYYY